MGPLIKGGVVWLRVIRFGFVWFSSGRANVRSEKKKMAEGAPAPVEAEKFGIATEPLKNLVFNAPFSQRQKANLRLTNNAGKTFYWQIKSTKPKFLIPSPTNGVLKPNENVVLMVNCEATPVPPASDRLSIEYVDAPDDAVKCDKTAFEGAAAVNRRVIIVISNE